MAHAAQTAFALHEFTPRKHHRTQHLAMKRTARLCPLGPSPGSKLLVPFAMCGRVPLLGTSKGDEPRACWTQTALALRHTKKSAASSTGNAAHVRLASAWGAACSSRPDAPPRLCTSPTESYALTCRGCAVDQVPRHLCLCAPHPLSHAHLHKLCLNGCCIAPGPFCRCWMSPRLGSLTLPC